MGQKKGKKPKKLHRKFTRQTSKVGGQLEAVSVAANRRGWEENKGQPLFQRERLSERKNPRAVMRPFKPGGKQDRQ